MLAQLSCDLLLTVSTLVLLAPEHGHTSRLPALELPWQQEDHQQVLSSSSFDQVPAYKVFYQTGKSEEDLPVCSPWSVCNKVDTYDTPRVERQCRCPSGQTCSASLTPSDGHTITDKNRQFKLCEPIKKLPKCRYFRDVTWTFITYPDNVTQQIMHCACPKNSVAYIIKRHAFQTEQGLGFQYSFACSPQSRLRCQRKEPCRLFTVKKRPQFEEVNTNTLCQCPHGHRCPRHHMDPGVIPGKTYTEDSIRTYSGYCM
ncbi:protein giant-lens [Penaeus vannamei]|uniref:protein giant-lens n=1 Tax=Penaeus vannamei TaxID=6689 RepID=UPI000F67DB40|nr:protein giant-lens-like [Penaeus vannamei]